MTTRSRHINRSQTSGWKYVTYLLMMCFLNSAFQLFFLLRTSPKPVKLALPTGKKKFLDNLLHKKACKVPRVLGGVHHTKSFQVQLEIVQNAFVNCLKISNFFLIQKKKQTIFSKKKKKKKANNFFPRLPHDFYVHFSKPTLVQPLYFVSSVALSSLYLSLLLF